jgi:hypothetical protein
MPKLPRFKFCQNPPTVLDLVELISDGILTFDGGNGQAERKKRYVRFLYHIRKRTPDQEYLLQVLGIICPKHPVFEKGYKS